VHFTFYLREKANNETHKETLKGRSVWFRVVRESIDNNIAIEGSTADRNSPSRPKALKKDIAFKTRYQITFILSAQVEKTRAKYEETR